MRVSVRDVTNCHLECFSENLLPTGGIGSQSSNHKESIPLCANQITVFQNWALNVQIQPIAVLRNTRHPQTIYTQINPIVNYVANYAAITIWTIAVVNHRKASPLRSSTLGGALVTLSKRALNSFVEWQVNKVTASSGIIYVLISRP